MLVTQAGRGLRLQEDGSAVDPKAFLASVQAEEGRMWLFGVEAHAPEVYERIIAGDVDALQTYLREARQYHGVS